MPTVPGSLLATSGPATRVSRLGDEPVVPSGASHVTSKLGWRHCYYTRRKPTNHSGVSSTPHPWPAHDYIARFWSFWSRVGHTPSCS